MSSKGFLGGFCDCDELLWFIILFLLLFWNRGFFFGGTPIVRE